MSPHAKTPPPDLPINADTVTLFAEEAFALLRLLVDEQISELSLIDSRDDRRHYRFHERRAAVKEAAVRLVPLLPEDSAGELFDLADLFAYGPDYAEVITAALPFLPQEQRDEARRKAWTVAIGHILPGRPLVREACLYEGQISDDGTLPHFSCRALGDMLLDVMPRHPDCRVTVLAGHTHTHTQPGRTTGAAQLAHACRRR